MAMNWVNLHLDSHLSLRLVWHCHCSLDSGIMSAMHAGGKQEQCMFRYPDTSLRQNFAIIIVFIILCLCCIAVLYDCIYVCV